MRWFTRWWWIYLLKDCSGWTNFWCRVMNHPNGVVWYTSAEGACEPDYHCKDCGEDLG